MKTFSNKVHRDYELKYQKEIREYKQALQIYRPLERPTLPMAGRKHSQTAIINSVPKSHTSPPLSIEKNQRSGLRSLAEVGYSKITILTSPI